LVTSLSGAKMAELIEISFGMWTRGGKRNHVLGGGLDSCTGRGTSGGHMWAYLDLPAVDIFNLICQGASISEPLATNIL